MKYHYSQILTQKSPKKRKINPGFLISAILHILILSVPFSLTVPMHPKSVELFVMDERPLYHQNKKIIEPPKQKEEQNPTKKEEVEPPSVPKLTEEEKDPSISNLSTPAVAELPFPQKRDENEKNPVIQSSKVVETQFGSDMAPRFLHREMPIYPVLARRLGKEGRVLLKLTIDENGKLINVEVLEGAGYGFTEAAIDAVRKSTFLPAIVDGKPVTCKALLPIVFKLKGN